MNNGNGNFRIINVLKYYVKKTKIVLSLVMLISCISVFALTNNVGDSHITDALKDELNGIITTNDEMESSFHKDKPTVIDCRKYFGTVNTLGRMLDSNDIHIFDNVNKNTVEGAMPPIVS